MAPAKPNQRPEHRCNPADIVVPGPEEARDQWIAEKAGGHHVADLDRHRQVQHRQQREQQPGDQNQPVVEAHPDCVGDGSDRDSDQDLEWKVDEVFQRRVGAVRADRKLGQGGDGPVHAIDGVTVNESIDRGFGLHQPVLLEGEAQVGAGLHAAEHRPYGCDADQGDEGEGL